MFFTDENVVPFGHQNHVEFKDICDGRVPPQDKAG